MGSLCVALLAIALLPAGCIAEEQAEAGGTTSGPMEVRLLIDTRQQQTKAADTDVSLIKELRVYVFNASDNLVGHYYNSSLNATGDAYYVPLRLSEGGNLRFYVIANEQGAGISTLTESSTRQEVRSVTFNTSNIDTSKGLLMTGYIQQNITQQNQATVVTCPLTRSFSLLDVYFAKSDAAVTATVTGITLSDYTTTDRMYDIDPAGWTQGGTRDPLTLLAEANTHTVTPVVAEENQTTGNYGTVLLSHPLTRNSIGSNDWQTPPVNDQNWQPRLNITYTVDGEVKTAAVYLPAVERNYRYNIYCLIKATGIKLNIEVAPWDKTDFNIEWSDNYDFEFTPSKTAQIESGESYFPIAYTASTNPDDTNDFQVTFTLKKPLGARWVASLDNGQDFYFYNENDPSDRKYTPTGNAPTTTNEQATSVTLRLKATTGYNMDSPQQVRMTIRVQKADQTWSRLIINESNRYTTGEEDVIRIKQVPNN